MNTNRQADTSETAFLTPSLEAITEFQVETNGFKPEFGQAGGGSITFASKSGTNNLSGSGYGFFRHDSLDKKGFFEATKGIYKQSDVGGSLGGPLTIPNLYSGRNRTFFFASYEGFYNKQGSNAAFRSVPTPEMWDGDFSNWVNASGQRITIYDPATTRTVNGVLVRDPFPDNRIPARPVQRDGEAVHRTGQVGARAQSRRGSRHVRLCEQQLRVDGQEHGRDDEQVQLEDRSHAQQHQSRGVCVQPDEQRHQGRAGRRIRAAGTVQRFFREHVRRRSSSRDAGTGSARAW